MPIDIAFSLGLVIAPKKLNQRPIDVVTIMLFREQVLLVFGMRNNVNHGFAAHEIVFFLSSERENWLL